MGVPTLPKRDDTFLLYYLEDFAEYETDNCPSLFCLSPSTVQIILSALRFCVWPTRWRENRDDNDRKIAEGLWPDARKWGELAIQEVTYNMACDIEEGFNTLGQAIITASPNTGLGQMATALENMANAIRAMVNAQASCCGSGGSGSGGSGSTAGPLDDFGPYDPNADPPPDGFESWAQFNANKCAVATDIVTTMLGDINRMSALNLAGEILASAIGLIVPLLLSPIPGDEIAIIAGILLSVVVVGGAFLQSVHSIVSENFDEFVCILYNTEQPASAKQDFSDLIAEKWAAAGNNSIMLGPAQMLVGSFLNANNVNRLFKLEAKRQLQPGDCSGCGNECEPQLSLTMGSGDITLNGEVRTLTAEQLPGYELWYVRITNTGDPCCMVYFNQVSWTGDIQPAWEINQFTCDGTLVWEQNWFFGTSPLGANIWGNFEYPGLISLGCNTPFTVDVILDTAH